MKSPTNRFIHNATKASLADLEGNANDVLTRLGYNELPSGTRDRGVMLLNLLKKRKKREEQDLNIVFSQDIYPLMQGFSSSKYFLHLSSSNKPLDILNSFSLLYESSKYIDLHPYLASNRAETLPTKPKLCLVSSVFNCPELLEKCLLNVTQQTLFSEIQVLLFDASTNGESYSAALPFLAEHYNIIYFKLRNDIGLYSIWNLGATITDAQYLGNLNTDDLRHPLHGSSLVDFLGMNRDIDIVSTTIIPWQDEDSSIMEITSYGTIESTSLMTKHEPWYTHLEGVYSIDSLFLKSQDGKAVSSQCIPHCAPIWRKSIHSKVGFFNEDAYYSAADWGLWLTALSLGSKAAVINRPYTYYYVNQTSYMRRDTKAEELINTICSEYEDSSLSAALKRNIINDINVPNDVIDFAVNLRPGPPL